MVEATASAPLGASEHVRILGQRAQVIRAQARGEDR